MFFRFANIGNKFRHYLVHLCRDLERCILPPTVQVPAVAAMQLHRRQQLQSQDLLPRQYSVVLWQEVLGLQSSSAMGEETYSCATIRNILFDFIALRLRALLQASAVLNLRRFVLNNVPPLFETVLSQLILEYERVAAIGGRIRAQEETWDGIYEGSAAHLQWLMHRQAVSRLISGYLIRLQWTLYGRRAELIQAASAATAQETADSAHDSIEFQSSMCRWLGFSYLSVQSVSMNNSELDRCELLPLKKELDMLFKDVMDINADDGYLFQHASYAALLQILPRTSLVFPSLAARTNTNSSGISFKKKLDTNLTSSVYLLPRLDYFQSISKKRVDSLVLIDPNFTELVNLASIDSASLLTGSLQDRVEHHNHSITASILASSSWMSRGRKKLVQRDPLVQSNQNKISALYNLYLTSIRITRRRILGLLNYILVTTEWVCGFYSLIHETCANGAELTGLQDKKLMELAHARHTFSVDDFGVLHCEGRDKVCVVYEEAIDALRRLDDRLLRLATHAVKEAEAVGVANKLSALHDLYQCEVCFQEAKFRHVSLLLDVLEHTCDTNQALQFLQLIFDVLHLQACVDVSSRFVAADYDVHAAALNKASDLLRQVKKLSVSLS